MKAGALFLSAVAMFAMAVRSSAAEPDGIDPTRVVGTVYGKVVTAGDVDLKSAIDPAIRFDARDTERWNLMGRILAAFGAPVLDRFVKERKIEATADEIEAFQKNMQRISDRNVRDWKDKLAELKKKIENPGLSTDEKMKFEKERAMYERFLAASNQEPAAKAEASIARSFIMAWKTERELQRVYGGRVIFQQAGLEALDARRLLFEQAEKQGDLKFDDPGVRFLFYYYSTNMRHQATKDTQALEKPWFFEDKD